MAHEKSEPSQFLEKSPLTDNQKILNDELRNKKNSWKHKYLELNKIIKELLHTRPKVSHIRVRRTTCSKPIETITVKDTELEKLEKWCKDIDIETIDTDASGENNIYPEDTVPQVNNSRHNEVIYSFPPRRDDTKNNEEQRQVYIECFYVLLLV